MRHRKQSNLLKDPNVINVRARIQTQSLCQSEVIFLKNFRLLLIFHVTTLKILASKSNLFVFHKLPALRSMRQRKGALLTTFIKLEEEKEG